MYSFYTKKLWIPPCAIAKLLLIMRLTTIILITAIMQVSASSFAQKITLSESNSSLVKVFDQIRLQSGVDFVVSMSILNDAKPVSIHVKDQDLKSVLNQVFKNQDLDYTINDKFVVVKKKRFSFLDQVVNAFSAIDVRGRVLDQKGEPMVGASVSIKGSGKTVRTNSNGEFYLQNVEEKGKLLISYIGYQTLEVDAKTNLGNLTMILVDAKLEEVNVNAGYYTVKDSERTGSIARITANEIEKQTVTNVIASMQGRMAGVNIMQTTGVPGGAFKIEIRGRNSIREEGNSPLYIIDGMPFPTDKLEQFTQSIFQMGGPNPMEGINPADIESIEVLKDADATSIYGSRGANGVVLITTKKGKAGKTEYNFNAYTGIGKIPSKVKLMNTSQYLEMRKEAFANDGLGATSREYLAAYDINGTWDPNRYTDWQKELLGGTSKTNNIQFGVSGGSQQTRFSMSGANSTESTVFTGDFSYKKTSAHVGLNHASVDEKFKASFSGNYVISNNNQPFQDLSYRALTLAPNAPALYKENGDLNWESGFDNPLAFLEQSYSAKSNTLSSAGTFSYSLLSGLDIKATVGFVDVRFVENQINPHTMYNPSLGYDSSVSNISINSGTNQSWNIEPQLSFNRQIWKGKLNALIGSTFQEKNIKLLFNSGHGYSSSSLIENLGAAKTVSARSSNSDYRYNALFIRLNYNLLDKYIVNLTARRDGSSRFGPGKRFGNFGAVGLAWLFSKEKFAADLFPILSTGKLRSSYGTSGSDQIGDYQFLDTYVSSGFNYQGVAAMRPTRLYNPNFSWEANKKLEFALDLGFLNDRIFFTTAYFRNRSSSQLVGIPLPGMTGFSNVNANLNATVQNTGLELELKTTNMATKSFRWTTAFNLTIPRNKLVAFPGLQTSTYADQYELGQSLNLRKLYQFTGVDPKTGLNTFKDFNNDGIINYLYDQKKFIDLSTGGFGGLSNYISYKNIELDFVLHLEKRKASNPDVFWASVPGRLGAQPISRLDRWQKEGDISTVQRYSAGYSGLAATAGGRFSASDASYTDASFIRMKTLSLAYNFKALASNSTNLRLYLQGQNLFTITNYTGIDPESQSIHALPPLRVITMGIKLTY